MATVEAGRRAEEVVAEFLKSKGCEIIARNWRTRWCEIDVVACKHEVIYFCEVKYRLRQTQGSGLEYITPKKLQQMRFAAESWVSDNEWRGEYQLCAFEVSGPECVITGVVKDF